MNAYAACCCGSDCSAPFSIRATGVCEWMFTNPTNSDFTRRFHSVEWNVIFDPNLPEESTRWTVDQTYRYSSISSSFSADFEIETSFRMFGSRLNSVCDTTLSGCSDDVPSPASSFGRRRLEIVAPKTNLTFDASADQFFATYEFGGFSNVSMTWGGIWQNQPYQPGQHSTSANYNARNNNPSIPNFGGIMINTPIQASLFLNDPCRSPSQVQSMSIDPCPVWLYQPSISGTTYGTVQPITKGQAVGTIDESRCVPFNIFYDLDDPGGYPSSVGRFDAFDAPIVTCQDLPGNQNDLVTRYHCSPDRPPYSSFGFPIEVLQYDSNIQVL